MPFHLWFMSFKKLVNNVTYPCEFSHGKHDWQQTHRSLCCLTVFVTQCLHGYQFCMVLQMQQYYSRICLIRHLKGNGKSDEFVTSRGLEKVTNYANRWHSIIEARIIFHSNSYTYIVLLFAVKYKFMMLWMNATINSCAISGLLHLIKHLLNL